VRPRTAVYVGAIGARDLSGRTRMQQPSRASFGAASFVVKDAAMAKVWNMGAADPKGADASFGAAPNGRAYRLARGPGSKFRCAHATEGQLCR